MRIWLTGASGFVGRHLLPRLQRLGADVVGADQERDVSDSATVEGEVARLRPHAIVHLAAVSSVPDSQRKPHAVYDVNYLGARNVLRAAMRAAPGARVLLVGSGEVYGSAEPGARPFDEASPLRPGSPYAATKAAADLLGGVYAASGLDVLRLRPFTHTGPSQPETFVASAFARQLAEIEVGKAPPLLAVGNLDAVRDFLDVEDVVEAYARLLEGDAPAGVYNVASGVPVRIGDLLETLLSLARVRPEVRVERTRWRPAGCSVGSAARLRATTGWVPRIALRDTLARLLESWRALVNAS